MPELCDESVSPSRTVPCRHNPTRRETCKRDSNLGFVMSADACLDLGASQVSPVQESESRNTVGADNVPFVRGTARAASVGPSVMSRRPPTGAARPYPLGGDWTRGAPTLSDWTRGTPTLSDWTRGAPTLSDWTRGAPTLSDWTRGTPTLSGVIGHRWSGRHWELSIARALPFNTSSCSS
jgi:hypothetical protein